MAEESKRITELPEAQTTNSTDYVAIDSGTNGTRKIPAHMLAEVTVTDDGNGNVTITIGGGS